jgi:hypothetical protein
MAGTDCPVSYLPQARRALKLKGTDCPARATGRSGARPRRATDCAAAAAAAAAADAAARTAAVLCSPATRPAAAARARCAGALRRDLHVSMGRGTRARPAAQVQAARPSLRAAPVTAQRPGPDGPRRGSASAARKPGGPAGRPRARVVPARTGVLLRAATATRAAYPRMCAERQPR